MKHDGTDLFKRVCDGEWPGFTKQEDGGIITLVNEESGDRIQARTTTKGRYMVHKLNSEEKPLSFGQQLGNGTLKTNIQTRLARWGIETRPGRLQQTEARQARQEEEATGSPATSEPPSEPPTTDPTPEVDMTKAADEILSDVPTSIGLIAAHVLDLAKADGESQQIVERGVVCYDWPGDLYEVLRYLWPDLPAEPDPGDIKRLYVSLIPPMRQSGALRQMKDRGQEATWRVRDVENKTVAALPVAAPATPALQEEAAMTPTPAPAPPVAAVSVPPDHTPPEETEDVTIHKCPECVFADPSQYAVQMHINKFAKRPEKHPYDAKAIPCPEGCGAVRTEPYGVRKHCVERHTDKYHTDMVMCQKPDCLQWFESTAKYRGHLKDEHPEALRRTVEEQAPEPEPEPKREVAVPAARRSVPAAVNGSAPDAPEAPDSPDEAIAQAAYRMIMEHGHQQEIIDTLRIENAALRADVLQLRAEVRDKDRTLKNFKKKLDVLFET